MLPSMPTYTRADARLPVRLPTELLDAVRSIARRKGESLGAVVRDALRAIVAEEAERERREEPPQ